LLDGVSDPDPDYPVSSFSGAFSSVFARATLFVVTCVAAIASADVCRIGWQKTFSSFVIPFTIVVSFISPPGLLSFITLLVLFLCFLRSDHLWIWLVPAFIVEALFAWIVAKEFM
jgi:hypothetical protein